MHAKNIDALEVFIGNFYKMIDLVSICFLILLSRTLKNENK